MLHLRGLAVLLIVSQLPLITGVGAEGGQQEPGPPPPTRVPANRCRIIGVVEARRQLPHESGLDAILPVTPDTTLEALKIKVASTDKVSPDLPSFCWPGSLVPELVHRSNQGRRRNHPTRQQWTFERLVLSPTAYGDLKAQGSDAISFSSGTRKVNTFAPCASAWSSWEPSAMFHAEEAPYPLPTTSPSAVAPEY